MAILVNTTEDKTCWHICERYFCKLGYLKNVKNLWLGGVEGEVPAGGPGRKLKHVIMWSRGLGDRPTAGRSPTGIHTFTVDAICFAE